MVTKTNLLRSKKNHRIRVRNLVKKTKTTFNNDNIYIKGKKIDPNIDVDKKRAMRILQTIKRTRTTGGGY